MKVKKVGFLVWVLLLAFSILIGNYTLSSKDTISSSGYPPRIAITSGGINYSKIQSYTQFFSSLRSRVTGYPGYNNASNYIISEFRKFGLQVFIQNFSLAIPVNNGSWLFEEEHKLNITVYPLWPNGVVCSPANDVTGRLYYVGNGEAGKLDGVDMKDSILLMDFNSGPNWLDAAKLGAKAVIFVEPLETNKYEALTKATSAPLTFIRLYVKRDDGVLLKELAQRQAVVTLHSKVQWDMVQAYNVMGMLEGEQPDDVIVVSAHYDSWSIIPEISPAAEDSIGISAILEMARYFSQHEPLRTIWFLAYSGHWEATTGAVEWVESILLTTPKRVWLQIGLDFSSETPAVDLLHISPILGASTQFTFGQRTFATAIQYGIRFSWTDQSAKKYVNQASSVIREMVGNKVLAFEDVVKSNFGEDRWWGTQPEFYLLDTEASLPTSAIAFTIRTQYARRINWFTPLNGYNFIKWENVKPQISIAATIIEGFCNEQSWGFSWDEIVPRRLVLSVAFGVYGFTTLYGKVVEFNYDVGWYTPIDSALVRMPIFNPDTYLTWPFVSRYTISDENGTFIFHGLLPYMNSIFDAWKFDQDGCVVYTLDRGFYGTAAGISGGVSSSVYPVTDTVNVMLPVFRCVPIQLFDLIEPGRMRRTVVPDVRNPYHNFFVLPATLQVFDYDTKSPLIFYGTYSTWDGIGAVFVQPRTRIIIMFNVAGARPLLILTNSTKDNLEGFGFLVEKPLTIHRTAYKSLRDMFYLTKGRYQNLKDKDVGSFSAEEMLIKAEDSLSNATMYFDKNEFDEAYGYTLYGLSLITKAYSMSVMPLYDESSTSITFFSFIILPFALLFQMLLFPFTKGAQRIIALSLFLTIFFAIFSFVHPAFSIMASSVMATMGVGIILLAFFVTTIFVKGIRDIMEEEAIKRLGVHFTRGESVSVALHTISVSVGNMRRRPLYTILLFITVIVTVVAQSSLTSTSYGYSVTAGVSTAKPPYNGVLIKNLYGFPPETRGGILDVPYLTYLKPLTNGKFHVAPRVWLYPISSYPQGVHVQLVSSTENETRTLNLNPATFLGLDLKEIEQVLANAIIGPYALFETDEDTAPKAVIPFALAKELRISIGDRLEVRGLGIEFIIIGISNATAEDFSDFDGESILPMDPAFSFDLALRESRYPPEFKPVSMSIINVIIIPWRTALRLGGFISSIALIPDNTVTEGEMMELAHDIPFSTNVMTYVGYGNASYGLFRIFTWRMLGWNVVIVPLAICSLSIVNFMLSSIVSRKREISIYSSVGLSPSGAAVMFITESLLYALGGAIIGYLAGWGMNKLFIIMQLLPSDFTFNFVSLFILVSIGVIITSTLLASIYPVILASRLITPSLERKWKPPTKPTGDLWEVPLPVRSSENEARGILAYLNEYYSELGSVKPEYMIMGNPQLNIKRMTLTLNMLLTPTELNITQDVTIKALPPGEIQETVAEPSKDFLFNITIHYKSGDYKTWAARNYSIIDDLRKQMLLWRSLPNEQKQRYMSFYENDY